MRILGFEMKLFGAIQVEVFLIRKCLGNTTIFFGTQGGLNGYSILNIGHIQKELCSEEEQR